MRDVVVVGTGLSGLVAALRCQEEGLRVTLVARGVGSTHLAPGTIDVLGYAPELVENPVAALPALIERNPEHPYAAIGADTVMSALEWFKARFDDYRYVGSGDGNLMLPTAIGSAKPSALVPETMAAGDLRAGGGMVFVGLRQLKDFFPALAAENVAAVKLPSGASISSRAIQIEAPTGEADVNGLAFARLFDDAAFRRAVVTQVLPQLEDGEAVGLPAVLGTRAANEVWSEMQEALGRPVFEVPSLPPSVPGMRLYDVLSTRFERAGGRLVLGAEAVGIESDNGRVNALKARSAARTKSYPGRHFVLASGGFGAGAIEMDSFWKVSEKIFGLTVAGVPGEDEQRFGPRYFDEHPMGRAGIRVDGSLRPLDPDGNVTFANVAVVGACLGGAEPWKEKSGDGISLASGYRAAEVIIEESP